MQCLPNIEILTFLNWIDINGHARNRIGVPLDELFLNEEYHDQVLALEREYMRGRSMDSLSEKAAYERYVDCVLSELKHYVMKEYYRHPYDFNRLFCTFESSYDKSKRLFQYLRHAITEMEDSGHSLKYSGPRAMLNYCEGSLADSVRKYLRYFHDPVVCGFFLRNCNSVAGITLHFLEWVHERRKLQNISLRNIPADVMERYIHEYAWLEYRRNGLTDKEKNERETILCHALIQRKYDDYLGAILTESHMDFDSLDEIIHRSFNRTVRYKCTLLAEDDLFHILVRDYWEEMNSYSGDHLDIYYSESELEQKGWSTADKLCIRARVSQYPAIYLWEYALDKGVSISVGGLDCQELMELFKFIVDEIVKGHGLVEIGTAAMAAVNSTLKAKNTAKEMEHAFTMSLLNACAKLQSNENWVRNTDENGRNTYIKDILIASGYRVNDQTLSGLSPTGKSAGEIDLKIYGADDLPFTILEALNIKADHPCAWNRKYFRNHVNKLYTYDANGLSRNYLIIYATIPEFDRFTGEVIKHLSSSTKCPYGNAKFIDISSIETDFADLRLACARYLRNGKEIRLYVLCVKIEEKSSTL